MANSFFKVYRSLLDHKLWLAEPFTKGQAWVDLIGLANWGKTETIYKGVLQVTERGQLQTSYGWLAKRWQWSVGKVRRYFCLLNCMAMAHTVGTTNGITITLENYEAFQDGRQTNGITNGIEHGISHGITGGTHNKNNINNTIKESQETPIERVVDADGFVYVRGNDGRLECAGRKCNV